jgi:hypothetical protein
MTDEEIHDCFQQRSKDKTQERRLIANAIEEKLLYTKPQWQGLAKLHAKLIAENSPNIEWAIMLTEQALKEKNGD